MVAVAARMLTTTMDPAVLIAVVVVAFVTVGATITVHHSPADPSGGVIDLRVTWLGPLLLAAGLLGLAAAVWIVRRVGSV